MQQPFLFFFLFLPSLGISASCQHVQGSSECTEIKISLRDRKQESVNIFDKLSFSLKLGISIEKLKFFNSIFGKVGFLIAKVIFKTKN